jgi:membrane-associated protease RseP (regulator of RpoE activity)
LMVSPRVTSRAGLDFQVSSALADGVLDRSGFTITNNKVAEMFGIQVGDTIVKLNGQPVNSPLNAWWAYQETLIKNPNQAEMQLDLRRGSTTVRKTYRIK